MGEGTFMEVITIASLSAIIGVVTTLITLYRDNKKSIRQDAEEDTENSVSVKQEIKYISRGIEDIKYDTRSLMTSTANINERLIRAEESIKSAHDKIDRMSKI